MGLFFFRWDFVPLCKLCLLDDSVFRNLFRNLSTNFQKANSKKSIFKLHSSKSINRILEKYLQRNLHFRKLFCIQTKSVKYTCEGIIFYSLPCSCRVAINANILNHQKKWPEEPLKACCRQKAFCILQCNNCIPLSW